MRTFLALNLRPELRDAVHEAAAPLRETLARGVAWVAAPSLHLTMKFLGERDDVWVERVRVDLGPELRKLPACDLRIHGVGAFPSLERPTVLWIGVAANPTLTRLYQLVEDACAAHGAARERRPFHPHVTLGRVRAGTAVDAISLARTAGAIDFAAVERAAALDVMASVLGPGGARYRVVAGLPLGGRVEES